MSSSLNKSNSQTVFPGSNSIHKETTADGQKPDYHHLIPSRDLHDNPAINMHAETRITWAGLFITLLATIMVTSSVVQIISQAWAESNRPLLLEQIVFFAIILVMIYGNLLYQLTRLGYLKRLKNHRAAPQSELDPLFQAPYKKLTLLIPSYKEEESVIWQSLLSASLLQYPEKSVVLLIDDPANPSLDADRASLERTRELPRDLNNLLRPEFQMLQRAQDNMNARVKRFGFDSFNENLILCTIYQNVADWFWYQAKKTKVKNHTDTLFVQTTFIGPAKQMDHLAEALSARLWENSPDLLRENQIRTELLKLKSIFWTQVSGFERKTFANLSHESNKAMNLNSYLALIGKRFRFVQKNNETLLETTDSGKPDLEVRDTDYVITLDADSILTPDYAVRLIHFMEQSGNQGYAVVQTPYSTAPHAPGLLERVAGATTDIQYIIHQGFTAYNATFWVGANALLRMTALNDIREVVYERGFPVSVYIQDRTVIEDTESSIDLVDKGWQLYNYPRRLSFSATPPDFGSFLIQRRRWANGGLIILPKLLKHLWHAPWNTAKFQEAFMRFHYLVSIAAVNLALPILIFYPFEANMRDLWLPLTALPYFFLYGRDLLLAGYGKMDLFRVYTLNIMLIPINLGGVLKSIQQGITRKKIPFGRTPKVSGRTCSPKLYLLLEYGLLFYCVIAVTVDLFNGRWMHALLGTAIGLALFYAIKQFIGIKNSLEDLFGRKWTNKIETQWQTPSQTSPTSSWSQPSSRA